MSILIINSLTMEQQLAPKTQVPTKFIDGVPEFYFSNPRLKMAKALLPENYNFEIEKSLYRIDQIKAELAQDVIRISLQLPEGLMLFACLISDILKAFSGCETVILGDVTYGACCVDDLASTELGCHLLIHYGHSCLVPITETKGKILYVFVEMKADVDHFVKTVELNFHNKQDKYYLLATIQFNRAIFEAKQLLQKAGYDIVIPQEKPRSGGQVLGCTSPTLPVSQNNQVIFFCDGRFHMQATMIANPGFTFYQYHPYARELTLQQYANEEMMRRRKEEITRALSGNLKCIAFIFGTLGRQGNKGILDRMIQKIQGRYDYVIMLSSQVNQKLLKGLQSSVDFVVQISCPRLSIDWGYKTPKPLLTPYQFLVILKEVQWREVYPMDYYSNNGGMWTNYFGRQTKKPARVKLAKQEKQKCPV